MRITVLVFLLAALDASARWISPVEQSYGPYAPAPLGSQPALVAAQNRVLLAWSEIDPVAHASRIHVGLLDFDGRLVSPIGKLPLFSSGGLAWSPVVATDGSGFYVSWVEPVGAPLIAGIALDATGRPIGSPRFLGRAVTSAKPVTAWTGSAYVVGPESFPITLDQVGEPMFAPIQVPTGFRYAADGMLVGVTSVSHREEVRCNIARPGCAVFPAQFEVTWTLRRGGDGWGDSYAAPYFATTPVIAAGADLATAIVWGAETSPATTLRGIRVVNAGYHSSFDIETDPLELPPRAEAIAFDGERWLVVTTSGGDVHGAFVDQSGSRFKTFAIANSARIESRSQVIALSPGRFLVTYDSDLPEDHRIAGRIVLTGNPAKRRSAR